jgi:hypothetical protein
MSRKQIHRTRAAKQARYREDQKNGGVPTGEVVAMSALRCTIAWMLLQKKEAVIWALSDFVERDLMSRHYARTLTPGGIEKRFTAILEDVKAHLDDYRERLAPPR